MAIEKDIAIHRTKGVQNVISYTTDREKSELNRDISDALSYAENLEKTLFRLDGDPDLLVSGILCSKDSAAYEFEITRREYEQAIGGSQNRVKGKKIDRKTGKTVDKESIEAYHVIQSFPEIQDLDPRLVHQIGKEYAEQAFPGHQCVVSTHMNTGHLHNHIVVCAYSRENIGRKYCMTKDKRRQIRKINDELSLKYGLPILIDTDLSQAHSHQKSVSWHKWHQRQNGTSWKEPMYKDLRSSAKQTRSRDEYSIPVSDSSAVQNGTTSAPDNSSSHTVSKPTPESTLTRNNYPSRVTITGIEKITLCDTTIHLSRYTESGRRRSDLELLLLAAIKILLYFKDLFRDTITEEALKNPENEPYQQKIQTLNQALQDLRAQGIETEEDLKTRLNQTGITISRLKKKIKTLEAAQQSAPYETFSPKSQPSSSRQDSTSSRDNTTENLQNLKALLKESNKEYKTLILLKKRIEAAKSEAYLKGPLYSKVHHQTPHLEPDHDLQQ